MDFLWNRRMLLIEFAATLVAVGLLAIAHALEPVVGVRFEVVTLVGVGMLLSRQHYRFGLDLARLRVEYQIVPPAAEGLRQEEELRAPFAAG